MSEWEKRDQVDIISPIRINGSYDTRTAATMKRRYWLRALVLTFSLGVLVAGGGALLYHLSEHPVRIVSVPDEDSKTESGEQGVKATSLASEDVSEMAETQSPEPVQTTGSKEETERRLTDFLLAKKELDAKGGEAWGGDHYLRMIELSDEADALFVKEQFDSAADKYAQASTRANELLSQSQDALRRVVNEGRLALENGDGELAQSKLNVALMIDPSNEYARHSLDRARNIEKVMQLIESGEAHEGQKDLDSALADYQEALRLDPQSDAARASFNRVKSMIGGAQFQSHMSSGFRALNKHDYEHARDQFIKARSFNPDSAEVRDALAQVDQAIRLDRISDLRKRALAAEQEEDWERALESYLAVLKMDEAIQFAVSGKARSLEQIRINKHIQLYLEKPEFLESDGHLKNAVQVLQEASEIEPKGPRLAERVGELERVVKTAQTAVKITLESDNLTEVAVYRIGILGRFHTRELHLRPGTYTVVGAREGYRDVRQKIAVNAGVPLRVTVKCTERIRAAISE